MSVRWLAAALVSNDIAPHPNFGADEVDAADALALVCDYRRFEFQRYVHGVHGEPHKRSEWTDAEISLVEGIARIAWGDAEPSDLKSLLDVAGGGEVSEDAGTVARLLVSVARDREDQLSDALEALVIPDAGIATAESRLCAAVVHLRRSALLSGLGQYNDAMDAIEAAEASLKGLKSGEFRVFRVSDGVSWTSRRTINKMLIEARAVARSRRVNLDPGRLDRGWPSRLSRVIRSETPHLLLLNRRREADALAKLLDDNFDEVVDRAQVISSSLSPQTLDRLLAALLHAELCGEAGSADRLKALIGKLRITFDRDDPTSVRGALRNLRQAGDRNALRKVLHSVRTVGPLQELEAEVYHVARLSPELVVWRDTNLPTLEFGARLLDPKTAAAALEKVLMFTDVNFGAKRPGRIEADFHRVEPAWDTAAALAEPAGASSNVAERVLERMRHARNEFESRSLARTVEHLDWTLVSPHSRLQWRSWLEEIENRRPDDETAEVILFSLAAAGDDVTTITRTDFASKPTISTAARLFYTHESVGKPITDDQLAAIVEICASALRDIQGRAEEGNFGFGGLDPAALLASVMLERPLEAGWASLSSFLLDPVVAGSDKGAAFEILARADGPYPPLLVEHLQRDWDRVLEPAAVFPWDEVIRPYPPAFRFGLKHLSGREDAFITLSKWAGGGIANARIEAARTLFTVTSLFQFEWATLLALMISHDADARVRGLAGGALCRGGLGTGAGLTRARELLRQDGIFVPLLTLRGIEAEAPPELVSDVEALSHDHPDLSVRREAALVLSRAVDTEGREDA